MVDDTDHDRILVFRNDDYELIQTINVQDYLDDGYYYRNEFKLTRPHFVLYDPEDNVYLCTLSWANAIMIMHNSGGGLRVDQIQQMDIKSDSYLKFISKINGYYYICELDALIQMEYKDNSLQIVERYPIPESWYGSVNYFTEIGDYYYISTWEKGLIRISKDEIGNLIELDGKEYVYSEIKGIPYYISEIDGQYWMTDIVSHQGVMRLHIDANGEINDIEYIFEYDELTEDDLNIKNIDPVLR